MKKTVLLLSLVAFTSQAAERVALVIGNDAYQHAEKLGTAVNDAKAVAARLRQLDFDVISVPDADVEQTLTALETLKTKAAGASAVVVYFAGHGIESEGVNYLIPVDAKLEREIQLKTQAVSLDMVLDELKRVSVPARMVILDCCRNNPLQGRAWLATRSTGGGLAALAQDTLAEATLVVYSASPGKPALDRVDDADDHSPFTAALLDELPKPGVHSFEMFGNVEDAVIKKTGSRQFPRVFYNGSTQPFRNFRFAKAAPVVVVPTPPPSPVTTPPPSPTPTPAPAPAMVVNETPPPAPPAPVMPTLPASGFFDLDALFAGSTYASYNSYSRAQILKQAQAKLKTAGHYSSSADGAPGPGTQRGILAYQQANNLPLTGKLDTTTLSSLGLTGIQPMTTPAPTPRPAPSQPKRRPSASGDDFFRNT